MVTREATLTQQREYRQWLYRIRRGFGVTVEPHVMAEVAFEETRSVIGGLAYPATTEEVTLYRLVLKIGAATLSEESPRPFPTMPRGYVLV